MHVFITCNPQDGELTWLKLWMCCFFFPCLFSFFMSMMLKHNVVYPQQHVVVIEKPLIKTITKKSKQETASTHWQAENSSMALLRL